MESIYGTNKKYLQSLTAGSDYYRTSPNVRSMTNDYSSYHNTMGRRSTLVGPYQHMNKYSYPTDHSQSSHYGYTSWGLWRDSRNLAPSVNSNNKHRSVKSFTVLLMSAAFIVILAVISVAGLAFYFSTFKSDSTDSILVFDCSFRVTKGDIFTSGLKSNQTSVYRQKSTFYDKVVRRSLEKSGLTVTKTEIRGFGDGPVIELDFRIFLDMRKIQMTISNVEEHVRNALIREMASKDSVFENVRIDPDEIEIKRLLDHEVLKSASFIRSFETDIDQITPLDEKLMMNNNNNKKSGSAEKNTHKFPSPTNFHFNNNNKPKEQQQHFIDRKIINESEIDMENLPVIQGSFEITKTDADITEKRENVNNKRNKPASATLKPFMVTPASIKIKSVQESSQQQASMKVVEQSSVEKVEGNKRKYDTATAKIEKTNKIGVAAVVEKTTTVKSTTLQPVKEVTFSSKIANFSISKAPTPAATATTMKPESVQATSAAPSVQEEVELSEKLLETTVTNILKTAEETLEDGSLGKDLPKLNVNLFTSAPVLDHEPWRPINAPAGSSHDYESRIPYLDDPIIAETASLATERPYYAESMLHRNKFHDPENILPSTPEHPSSPVYYQSYNNPTFVDAHTAIEKLGTIDVKPYPLPIDKISQEDIPDFKYLTPTMIDEQESIYDTMKMSYDTSKFEHLGGGVIVKKAETSTEGIEWNATLLEEFLEMENVTMALENTTDVGPNIGELLLTLLDIDMVNQNTYNVTSEPEKSMESLNASTVEAETATAVQKHSGEMMSSELEIINQEPFQIQSIPKHPQGTPNAEDESNESVTEFLDAPFNFTVKPNSEKDYIKNATFELSNTSVETMKTSSENPTTSFVEVQTTKYTPVSLELFPQNFQSNTKWQFVNGSGIAVNGNVQMKRVYNDTLQAWIVENSQMPQNQHKEYQVPKTQATATHNENLQNISTIFDTLASKLGIKPDTLSKPPPFSSSSQTKLKNNAQNKSMLALPDQLSVELPESIPLGSSVVTEVSVKYEQPKETIIAEDKPKATKNNTKEKDIIRIVQTETPRTTTARIATLKKKPAKTTRKPTVTTTFQTTTPVPEKPSTRKFYLETSPLILESSSEQIVGQAEVIEIDPTQYTELLRMASSAPLTTTSTTTETSPSLITLLPVKSNSGLRTLNPRLKLPLPIAVGSSDSISRKFNKFPLQTMETIVRASMNVDT